MSQRIGLCTVFVLVFAAAMPAFAQPDNKPADVQRVTVGNRVSENIPPIPAGLAEQLNRYQNFRGAELAGWTRDGCLLISTRFAETAQVHRVCKPLGMREQLTFYPEPVSGIVPAPAHASRDGFVFARDKGGDEFSQLYWFDAATRATTLLTDGGRSQNEAAIFSRDGGLMAWTSTARNGTDHDVWLRDTRTGKARVLVDAGGLWTATDFSPDGSQLLVTQYVSAAESHPGVVDVASGKLTPFPVDGGKAAFGDFAFAPDGKAVYFVSDEPLPDDSGKLTPQEFQTLRFHDPATGKFEVLTAAIPWDVEAFRIADDGRHLAFVVNEDGVSKLHVMALPSHAEIALPPLPIGVIDELAFSPDGGRLAVAINSATSPSDVQVIDLAKATATRWTASEVGGMDASTFIAPTVIHYPSFDGRSIPAFFYKPTQPAKHGKYPVVIRIHGGPEGQARPVFTTDIQITTTALGVAVLAPNVRGSAGYGKTWLSLDNGAKREDSVKDIGALLDWIATQPDLDASRVGVIGGSYGGYMTLASLVHYSDRIRAATELYGASNFISFLKNTESYRRDLRRVEYGDERDPVMNAVFQRISPLNNVAKIKAPLFVAQGRNDPRVPMSEAEQIVKAVRGNGQPVWYVLFNDEGHGFRKKINNDYFNAVTMLFWQHYLLDDHAAVPGSP